jgi:hypothetical protein
MLTQDNMWRDMRRASRIIGAVLTMVGGFVIAFQSFLSAKLPPMDGFTRVEATVIQLDKRGTFREPTFQITLVFPVTQADGSVKEHRSGRKVDFAVFDALSKGDRVKIDYNTHNPYEWRLIDDFYKDELSDYALGLLMILLGSFSLVFPTIVRLASREDDFRYPEDLKAENRKEQTSYHYDKIAHG